MNKQFTDKLDELLTEFYKKTLRVDGNTPDARAEARQQILTAIEACLPEKLPKGFKEGEVGYDEHREAFLTGWQSSLDQIRQALGISDKEDN